MSNEHEQAQDSFRQRAREAEVFAPSWQPAVGDELFGTVVGFTEGPTKKYGRFPVVLIETEDDVEAFNVGSSKPVKIKAGAVVSFWLLHKVARNSWFRVNPGRGERVAIRRLEDRQGTEGDYADYRVVADRPDGERLDPSRWGFEADEDAAPAVDPAQTDAGL